MQSILDAINEWIKGILIGAINGNLSTMFGDVNEKVGTIATQVGQTPQGWNANIFSMIQTLSENVVVPIAGLVITYVLCYELISMVVEKNNMHDVDTFMFFKWFFKAFVAVFLVTHTFDITMAVFYVAPHAVFGAGGGVGGGGQPIHDGEELAGVRGDVLWGLDRRAKLRNSYENPSIVAIYKDFLGEPNSELAEELLHTDHHSWCIH